MAQKVMEMLAEVPGQQGFPLECWGKCPQEGVHREALDLCGNHTRVPDSQGRREHRGLVTNAPERSRPPWHKPNRDVRGL